MKGVFPFGCLGVSASLCILFGVADGTSKNMWFCVVVCVLCVFRVVVVVLVGVPFCKLFRVVVFV